MANFLRFNGVDNAVSILREVLDPDLSISLEVALPAVIQDTEYYFTSDTNNDTHTFSYRRTATNEIVKYTLGTLVREFTFPIAGSPLVSDATKFEILLTVDLIDDFFRCFIDGIEASNAIDASAFIRYRDFNILGRLGGVVATAPHTEFDFYRLRVWSDATQTTLVRDYNADSASSNGAGTQLYEDVSGVGYSSSGVFPTWQSDSPTNQAPIANAGADQNVDTGIPVQLDGSGSSDPELATLTYLWTLSVPVGSSATLSNANIVNPTFTPDIDGTYTASLVVNDGTQDSAPNDAVITATTVPNVAPTANAGTDQVNVEAGSTVTLDGTDSTDSDGVITTYEWTQTAGDSVVLDTANPARPTFPAPSTASPQTLTFSLVVTDNDGASSAADTVNIGVSAQQSVIATPDEIGLRLTTLNASYVTIPQYTFPTSGIVTITARFYLETENINRSIFVLRNAPFEVSFSISQLGVGSFYVATDTNAQSLQAGNFTHDNYYVVVLTLDMVSGAMTADVNGATFADTIGTDVQSLQGVTTGTGFNSAIGSAFGATFLEGVFYQLNINSTDNYSTNDSNTSVGEVVDTLGGASGVIQSYEANQWVNLVTPIGDITPPVITLNGSANVVVQQGDTYTDAGATALDNVDGVVAVSVNNPVDTLALGTYTVTYTATDSAGNTATATRTVVVEAVADITAPVITVTPGNQTLTVGDAIPTFTATATDDRDGDITADIVETGDVIDNQTAGTYVRRWNVQDSAGNNAVEVTRIVVYEEVTQVTSTLNLAITNIPDGTHATVIRNVIENTTQVQNVVWASGQAAVTLTDIPVGTVYDYYVANINNDGGAGLVINQETE